MADVQKVLYYASNYNLEELIDIIDDYKDRVNYLVNEVEDLEQKLYKALGDE